jgi:eukaryotic-like serine/threonine-protein kinase
MLAPGTILQERYRIVNQVGKGGMGSVYLAHDLRLRNKVALKETLFSNENNTYRRAFEQEAQILARLRHQALPKVIDHFIEGNGQFLVMEYIPGEDLGNQLTRFGKRFASPQVLTWVVKWADQLLDVLHYLHTRPSPVIHRDIKPKNLKLGANTHDIFLLDFGLARGGLTLHVDAVDGKDTTTPESMVRKVYGFTAPYAPVEQINNAAPDPRSDLYSLAATLYHMLTGTLPIDAMSRMARIFNSQDDSLPPIRSIAPHVPEPIAAVFEQALAVTVDARPQSAQTMREALTQARRQIERTGHTPPGLALPPTGRSTEIATPRISGGATPALTPVNEVRETQPVGTLIRRMTTGSPVRDLAFSPDGTLIAAGYDDHSIGIWSTDQGTHIGMLHGHTSSVRSLTFSPDGSLLASGSDDETVRIWNVQDRSLKTRILCRSVSVESVVFSPDGTLLAIGGWGRSITLCRSTGGRFEKFGDLPSAFVHSLSFAPDGSLLAAGGFDGIIYLWRSADHQPDGKIEGFSNFIYSVAFSPDGTMLAASSQAQVRIWRTSDRRQIEAFQHHTRPVQSLAFSHDSQILATGSADCTVRFWRCSDGTQLPYILEHSASVTGIRYSPNGRTLAAATHDGRIFLWRAPQ